jgi:A/G-specific adenine glycosylase
MELGALVCLPENPQCLLCPLLSQCQAAQKGLQNELPEAPQAVETVEVPMAALLIEGYGRILVRKRSPEERWLKGMWEFPSAEGKTFLDALKKLEKSLNAKTDPKELREVRHQITHHKVRLRLFRAASPRRPNRSKDLRWVSPKALLNLPFSSAQGKLREWVLKHVNFEKATFTLKRRNKKRLGRSSPLLLS